MKIFFAVSLAVFAGSVSFSFQTEADVQEKTADGGLNAIEIIEAGLATRRNVPLSLYHLAAGEYLSALQTLSEEEQTMLPWLKEYLEGLVQVASPLERYESEHFILFVPTHQRFLKDYALPSLEKTADHLHQVTGYRPPEKIRVEIYSTKEDFSAASTLTMETLERSGAIGICKFHRLMILSPKSLPLGYRWLDALSHEYVHLIVNELSASHAELWLHEGTARYFETSYRLQPPQYLTPHQKSKLIEAREEGKLIPFKRMSPSLVYLKDQDEVSLAFSQVSHAIGHLVERHGPKKFVDFLTTLKKKSFPQAFSKLFGRSPEEFESDWQAALGQEKWEKVRGALSDEVRFTQLSEESVIGAEAQAQVRLGDQMRQRGHHQAALIQYQKALSEEPDNAIILLKAGKTSLLLEDSRQAAQFFRRAIEKNPNYGTPYVELARLVAPEESLALLEEANAINPFNPVIHQLWSEAFRKLGQNERAQREEEISKRLEEGK